MVNNYIYYVSQNLPTRFKNDVLRKDRAHQALQLWCSSDLNPIVALYNKLLFKNFLPSIFHTFGL